MSLSITEKLSKAILNEFKAPLKGAEDRMAKAVLEVFRELYKHIPGPQGNQEDHLKLNSAINRVLEDNL